VDWPVNVGDLEPLARDRLEPIAYDYLTGGAADELTVADNLAAWRRLRLAPRNLVDVSRLDTSTRLLGHDLAHPILLAPVAAHSLFHPDAEHETLRGAAAGEALTVLSTMSSTAVGELGAGASSPFWFQLYAQRDQAVTDSLVARAVAAGAAAVVLTVDTPTLGARDRDRRMGLPPSAYPNLTDLPEEPDEAPPYRRVFHNRFSPALSWPKLRRLVDTATVPVLVKGVLRPDVAAQAAEAGVAGVVVSNHGGRNLDTVPATADALAGVVAAVHGRVPVLVDGGIRRGTDVAKALMLGADAVLVGRPYAWGLTVGGAEGVAFVLDTLRTELEMAMGLLGAPTLADLTPDLLWG
jgi:isopentenyl diphosphate isomerase/L-lactate dehydrogenase-like FMN-dependent dehydrogenase